jgi:hypothetical protein
MLDGRSFHQMNFRYKISADTHKGFLKKTNECSEHAIMSNELFNDVRRKNEDLIVTAIDFTNAFGSVPHVLIISTLRQLNFRE